MSSLDSLSDLSFISALSVQEECMVNLQMHLNKPITESSLLMPCYMSHLTQVGSRIIGVCSTGLKVA